MEKVQRIWLGIFLVGRLGRKGREGLGQVGERNGRMDALL